MAAAKEIRSGVERKIRKAVGGGVEDVGLAKVIRVDLVPELIKDYVPAPHKHLAIGQHGDMNRDEPEPDSAAHCPTPDGFPCGVGGAALVALEF